MSGARVREGRNASDQHANCKVFQNTDVCPVPCGARLDFGWVFVIPLARSRVFAGSERSTPRGVAYRRRQGLPVSLHLHQWLTTVGGPILTFSVTADGSFGRFGGPLARPCKQQLVARCVRHCVFWPKPVKENVASDGG